MLLRQNNDDGYLRKILFTDEAIFHVSGRWIAITWGFGVPRIRIMLLNTSGQPKRPRVDRVNFQSHYRALCLFRINSYKGNVMPQVEHLQPTAIFQQNGAPPHWGRIVRDYLDATFPNSWPDRDGPLAWPPRSADITPLDLFLWGYVKDKVYATKITGVEDLKTRIRDVIKTINRGMLARTWEELEFRLDVN
jgi:hypothetical protein